MPKFTVNRDFIPVSSYFVEHLMKDANGIFVKVYLYALNLACHGQSVSNAEIANALNILESDVLQAFAHWNSVGAISECSDVITFCQGENQVKADFSKPQTQNGDHRPAYAPNEAPLAVSENPALADLVALSQELLGKPLSPNELETLYWFYDGLKFAPEVILMLLEYCVSKDKRNINYIEKVAISWHEKGINSMDAVEQYLQNEEQKTSYLHSLRKIMGITDRALSQNEEQFLNKWHEHCGMSEEMVKLAYEQCIIQTAKLSFPYIDKIIERWYQQGIKTPEQAKADDEKFRNKKAASQDQSEPFAVYQDSYNHKDLASLAREKLNQD